MSLLVTAMTLGLLACRLHYTGRAGHLSLIWDLFLGWLPIVPALLAYRLAGRSVGRVVLVCLLLIGWLAFFPNAPYLVTELIHLHENFGGSPRPMPDWLKPLFSRTVLRDPPSWLEFLLLTSTAASGVLLTIASLRIVHRTVSYCLPAAAASLFVFVASCLAGLGVAIGRWDRFNSWDLGRRPLDVVARLEPRFLQPMQDPKLLMTAGVMGVLIVALYFAVTSLGEKGDVRRTAS
jgi:uncharacterized membrane protein